MSRFYGEINGQYGEWWKKHAEEQVIKYVEEAKTDAIVEEDGAIKWKSNGNYLMDDFCEVLEYASFPFSRENTAKKREIQNEEFFESYRKAQEGRTYSQEELFEMRSAFGEGTVVVDVVTGKEIRL